MAENRDHKRTNHGGSEKNPVRGKVNVVLARGACNYI